MHICALTQLRTNHVNIDRVSVVLMRQPCINVITSYPSISDQCQDNYTPPKNLLVVGCGHVVCEHCLVQMVSHQTYKHIRCPVCRDRVTTASRASSFRTQYFDAASGNVWSQISDFRDTAQFDRRMTASELRPQARDEIVALLNTVGESELALIAGECAY